MDPNGLLPALTAEGYAKCHFFLKTFVKTFEMTLTRRRKALLTFLDVTLVPRQEPSYPSTLEH